MKKVIAFGASNSRASINKVLAAYASTQLQGVEVAVLDLNDFELPLYGIDLEKESGIPPNAVAFREQIESADGIILSLAEHNGLQTAAFKNLFDWMSRINKDVWMQKPMLLMATSPGRRGGANALKVTKDLLPHFGGNVIADFSLPLFHTYFQEGKLINEALLADLKAKVDLFQQAM